MILREDNGRKKNVLNLRLILKCISIINFFWGDYYHLNDISVCYFTILSITKNINDNKFLSFIFYNVSNIHLLPSAGVSKIFEGRKHFSNLNIDTYFLVRFFSSFLSRQSKFSRKTIIQRNINSIIIQRYKILKGRFNKK